MFDFVGKRRWFFLGSSLVILVGIISLIAGGLNLGLDFKSGRTMTLVFSEPVQQADLRAAFGDLGYSDATIQHSPKDAFLLFGFEGSIDGLVDDLEEALDTTIRTANRDTQGRRSSPANSEPSTISITPGSPRRSLQSGSQPPAGQ